MAGGAWLILLPKGTLETGLDRVSLHLDRADLRLSLSGEVAPFLRKRRFQLRLRLGDLNLQGCYVALKLLLLVRLGVGERSEAGNGIDRVRLQRLDVASYPELHHVPRGV